MKTVIALFLTALLGFSSLQGAAFEKSVSSNVAELHISSQKPLSTGGNTLILLISDNKYKDSQVTLKAFMPAMPGMPYMESVSEALNLGDGEYSVEVDFAMSGTWQLHIFITPKEGKKVRVKSSLNI